MTGQVIQKMEFWGGREFDSLTKTRRATSETTTRVSKEKNRAEMSQQGEKETIGPKIETLSRGELTHTHTQESENQKGNREREEGK